MDETALWSWDTDTDLTREKCEGCKGPMMIGRNEAVKFDNKRWHSSCLLTYLAKFYHEHSSNVRYDSWNHMTP